MSSKYSQPYTLPDGFPSQLRSFASEVLRANPQDVNTFSYEYFMQKLEEREIEKENLEVDEKKGKK